MDKDGQIRHNKYVFEMKELIENAEYAPPPKDVKQNKKNKKSFIEKYHYFKVNVKVGETVYEIILDTEQYKGESENKPQTVHLYNIQEKSSGTYADNAYLNKPDDNNIVPHSDKNITSNQANVTKHEDKNIQFQSMTKEQLLNVYMNQEFGMSADDITDMVTEDIKFVGCDVSHQIKYFFELVEQ